MAGLKCPICGNARTATFFPKGGRELLICCKCRHVFWDGMPDPAYLASFYATQYTESYDQKTIQQEERAYYRSHAEELARYVEKPVSELSIADVGCSFPVFLEEVSAAGGSAIGVDWGVAVRAYGAERGIAMVTPDEMAERIPDGSLDVLRYAHTLEHMIDPAATLLDHVRKVRIGGLVYITQPNIPVFRFASAPCDVHDSDWPNHLHFFSPISLLRLSERAALSVERFFTVTDERIALDRYGAGLDTDYATEQLATLATRGELDRGTLNNYPNYLGWNSAIYLRRVTPAEPEPVDGGLIAWLRNPRHWLSGWR